MEFGIPKEARDFQSEARVGLTPGGVRGLARSRAYGLCGKGSGS